MKRIIKIDGLEITITASVSHGRFGALFSASDTYGEPEVSCQYFASAKQAMDAREESLRTMLA
jgi:hypothetical protein